METVKVTTTSEIARVTSLDEFTQTLTLLEKIVVPLHQSNNFRTGIMYAFRMYIKVSLILSLLIYFNLATCFDQIRLLYLFANNLTVLVNGEVLKVNVLMCSVVLESSP